MKIISLDKKSYVEFELIEIERDKRLPSIVISVTVDKMALLDAYQMFGLSGIK